MATPNQATAPKDALSEAEVLQRIETLLPKWQYKENALQRIHTCHDYLKSLALVNDVGHQAEELDHHPDLMLNYKRVTIRYWSHTAKGVTERDVECAQLVEKLIESNYL